MFPRLFAALLALASVLIAGSVRAQNPGAACGVAPEHSTLTLACPAGAFIDRVPFASYGNPSGACGSLVQGSCHAATSAAVLSRTCVFRASCTVSAENTVFGDPCLGTVKRLAAQVSCRSFPRPPGTCGYAADFASLTLACPAGQVVTGVTFASYGRPTGTCSG